MRIRIVSYNIHKGFSPTNIKFVLPEIARALADLEADVVFLQETVGEHLHHERSLSSRMGNAEPLFPQAEFLSKGLFPYVIYGHNVEYSHGHHGNAVLSKFPVQSWHNQDVSTNSLEGRGALHVVARVCNRDLHLVSTHLSLFENGRQEQVRMMAGRILEEVPPRSPLIIAGDFNDWRGTAGQSMESLLGVHEAFKSEKGVHARSFPAVFPFLTLDRVYFRGLSVVECHALTGLPWRRFSDHIPLMVDFFIAESDEAFLTDTASSALPRV